MEKEAKSKLGKKSRAMGADFERRTRLQLEKDGWIVFKNNNNVIDEQYKQGKAKFNPFTHALMMNSQGFPDFLITRRLSGKEILEMLKNEI